MMDPSDAGWYLPLPPVPTNPQFEVKVASMRLSSNKKDPLFSTLKIFPKKKSIYFWKKKCKFFLVMAIPNQPFGGIPTWKSNVDRYFAIGDSTDKVERCQCPRTPVSPYCAWGWQLWRGFQRELPDAWHLWPRWQWGVELQGHEALGLGVLRMFMVIKQKNPKTHGEGQLGGGVI